MVDVDYFLFFSLQNLVFTLRSLQRDNLREHSRHHRTQIKVDGAIYSLTRHGTFRFNERLSLPALAQRACGSALYLVQPLGSTISSNGLCWRLLSVEIQFNELSKYHLAHADYSDVKEAAGICSRLYWSVGGSCFRYRDDLSSTKGAGRVLDMLLRESLRVPEHCRTY